MNDGPALIDRSLRALPPDARARRSAHDEVHARPAASVRVPALVTHVAVLHDGCSPEREHEHLARLIVPGSAGLTMPDPGFIRARIGTNTLKWERHGEFSRYSITQPLDQASVWGADDPDLVAQLGIGPEWLRAVPGKVIVASQIALLESRGESESQALAHARRCLAGARLAASYVAGGLARLYANFVLREDGFNRFVLLFDEASELRAGRIASVLAELETYRTMTLLAFPAARALNGSLRSTEAELADITRAINRPEQSDGALLDQLIRLAGEIETATAETNARFAAARAYAGIVEQRLAELDERPMTGAMTVGGFLRRRLVPAVATIESASKRLADLSERISRSSSLLRTRVDIANESRNQSLLQSLERGQRIQLRLQETVEGLSVAAISYYVVGLIAYLGKTAKEFGAPIAPEILAGVAVPFVVLGVWWLIRRVRSRIQRT
jgi:uncharacterized membrane-anchored protein